MNLVLIGGLGHRSRHVAAGDLGYISNQIDQPIAHTVDGEFHLLVVALTGKFDFLTQVAATDQPENPVAFGDGQEDGIQHLVDALHDARISALELAGFAAFRELSFARCLSQPPQLLLQTLQDYGHVVDRLFHLLVVATVGLGDQFVDLARADLRQDTIALRYREQDRIEHGVHALDQLAVVPFELLYPRALAETACARGFHQPLYFLLQQIPRLRRIMFRTVQNGGADGPVSLGANAPAIPCLSCHCLLLYS